MSDQSSIFPAFIRAEYDGSGSGFAIFEKEAGESAARARRTFESNFAEVQRVVSGAVSRGLKPSGAMDLGVDGFRQAAAQAKVYEASLRNTRDAANALAISTNDTSAETRSYLQALSAQVIEAQHARDAAEAQVTTYTRLQTAIDATASRNGALATSYREVYAEQARAARDEVRGRRAQEGYNAVFAPGLSQSATDGGAGFQALEQQLVRQQALVRELNAGVAEMEQRFAREGAEQARASDLATAALVKQTAALEELRRAEAGAANGAAMLNAIIRETGAGAASGGSAASSAAAFEQHFAEQARAAEQYAQAASRLRAELDPMFLAQQRFDRELDRADDLMKAGAISAREYAQAQQHARNNLQAHSEAIHTQNDAFQQLARGSGVLRQAYIQTGQQGQDLVISLIGGQKASVVFAQQLPQLAFALSGLGMQADGTQKGIGRIATLLSGPWGIAFAGAAFAVGLVVEKLWQQDEASKAAEKSNIDFSNSIVASTGLVGDYTNAITQLDQATKGLINTQALMIDNSRTFAQTAVSQLSNKASDIDSQIATLSKSRSWLTRIPGTFNSTDAQILELQDQRRTVQAELASARSSLSYAQTALEARQAAESADPNLAGRNQIERERARLTQRRQETIKQGPVPLAGFDALSKDDFNKQMAELARREKALSSARSSSPTARLNAQARLDAADSPIEIARAELGLEKAKSGELLRQGKISEAQYLSNVRSRELEVQRQQGLKEATAQGARAAKEYQRLLDFGSRSAETIQRVNEQFDDQPRLIDRAAQATRKLDEIIAELQQREPPGFKEMIADAERAKDVVANGLTKPYRDLLNEQQEQLVTGRLVLDGRREEAEAVSTILRLQREIGPIDAKRRQVIIDNVTALHDQERAMDKLQAQQAAFLNASAGIKSSIRQSIADIRTDGFDAMGGLVNNFMATFDNLLADVLTENLFGDIFRGIDEEIRAANGVKSASQIVNEALLTMATKAEAAGNAMAVVANTAAGAPVAAANDNVAQQAYADIVVTGRNAMEDPVAFMSSSLTKLFERFMPEDLAKQIGDRVGSAVQGAAYGQMAGGLVLGAGNNKIGSAIGGALGKEAGDALGKMVGGTLGKALGPLGSIAGGILGGAIGGMLTPKKWGTAVVTGNGETDVSVGGNKSAYRDNAGLAGTSIQSGLSAIADQLGVDVGGYNVSIGQYKGNWRVSGDGRTGKLKGKYSDVTDFGEDGAEDAIKFAIADAVKDGALIGLRASTQALLSASDDVEAQLQKALDFENVFARLKSYKDPVGAAMDTLDKEFSRLKKIFDEAGASAGEYAELEELYGIERAAAVKEAGEKVTASLKSLFDELTLTNDARSLRDRLVEAQAQYSPLAQRVAAGDTSAYDDYSDIARTMLDLQRQISGSGTDYFKLLDEITGLTKTRIDSETNIASLAAARESMFASSESSMAPVVSATESQTAQLSAVFTGNTQQLLTAMQVQNDNLIALTRTIAAQGGSNADNNLTAVRNNF